MNKLIKFLKDWRNQAKYGKWLFCYTKPYMPKIFLIMLFGILSSVMSTYMAVVCKGLIDSAIGGNIIITALIVYISITVLMMVIDTVGQLISVVLDEKFSFGIRKQVYEQIINSHWMSIKKYHTGDLMTRLTSDAGAIANGIIYTIPTIIQLFVTLCLCFVTLFYFEPMLALMALVIGPVAAVISLVLGKKLKKLQEKVQESESKYRSYVQESLANLLIVKSFVNEDYATKRLVELRDERFKWVYKKSKVSIASSTAMSFVFQLGYIVAFTYGALNVSSGNISYGTMTLFLTLINRVQSPIVGLAQQIPKIVSILASAGRVMELENIPLEEKDKENIPVTQVGMEVKNLSFCYDGEKENVFTNADFSIKPGEFVAILGESGIGKTTLIRLVMSFMREYEGEITFVNQDGEREVANAKTREFLSYVPQGNTLFSGSIRENIMMGKLDATEEEIEEALKMSASYDFVQELPNGVDTVIGERGHGISEGQAQRIAIARALIKKAPFLILDEATSALDMKTEMDVIHELQNLTPRPTCLIITHRPSILDYCDRQILIEDQKIVNKKL